MLLSIMFQEPPFVFKTKELPLDLVDKNYYYNETNGYYYYGYCIDLIFHINSSQNMQFEFTLLEPADNLYGTMQPNNSWNGMINELVLDVRIIILCIIYDK